jgi:hypothetical protein
MLRLLAPELTDHGKLREMMASVSINSLFEVVQGLFSPGPRDKKAQSIN